MQLKNTVSSIDLIERHPGSAVWAPYHSEQGIVIVSKENPATKWVSYDGYFGVPLGKPSFTHATETWGGKLPPLAVMSTAIIGKIAESTVHCRACNPTLGLGARHHLRHPHVSNWKHIQVSSASGLVRSLTACNLCLQRQCQGNARYLVAMSSHNIHVVLVFLYHLIGCWSPLLPRVKLPLHLTSSPCLSWGLLHAIYCRTQKCVWFRDGCDV